MFILVSLSEVPMCEFTYFLLEFGAETFQIWSTHEVSISWKFQLQTPSESGRTRTSLFRQREGGGQSPATFLRDIPKRNISL